MCEASFPSRYFHSLKKGEYGLSFDYDREGFDLASQMRRVRSMLSDVDNARGTDRRKELRKLIDYVDQAAAERDEVHIQWRSFLYSDDPERLSRMIASGDAR
jgi:hypothetical protein